MNAHEKIIKVALNVPVNELFDYLPINNDICVGQHVKVPFGKRQVIGIVYSFANDTQIEKKKLKKIIYADKDILFDKKLLKLLTFVSDYYHFPIGQTIMSVVPSRIKRDKSHIRRIELLIESTKALTMEVINNFPKRQTKIKRLAEILYKKPIRQSDLTKLVSNPMPLIKKLESMKLCKSKEWLPEEKFFNGDDPPQLTNDQNKIISKIIEHKNFNAWLIHGITGSGKTEIYLRLIQHFFKTKQQALILVPEINLTPQLEIRFRQRFNKKKVVILHSFISDRDRLMHWQQAKSGEADIIIGTRLAVFTPMKKLGLIIIDEEHDSSFKQQEGLKYHARDVALVRAKELNIPVIMGSATPSLESWLNTKPEIKKFNYFKINNRAVLGSKLPNIKLIPYEKNISNSLSKQIISSIQDRLNKKEQVLIFINRRGYSPVLACTSCGWSADCHRCSSKLVCHLKQNKLRCHHCDHHQPIPPQCPNCGNLDLLTLGKGTQRVEDLISDYFPKSRILRVDRDSMKTKKMLNQLYETVNQGEIDILIGTQMLSKGHDFKKLSLVIALDIDHALYSTNFRSTERIFSQLTQVAGRSGRSSIPGEVLIQTNFPSHPLFYYLKNHDFNGFADSLLQERKQMNFIPYGHMAIFNVEGKNLSHVDIFVEKAVNEINKIKTHTHFFGPVKPAMQRLKGFERSQIFFRANDRKDLHIFLKKWIQKVRLIPEIKRIKHSLDIDPIDF